MLGRFTISMAACAVLVAAAATTVMADGHDEGIHHLSSSIKSIDDICGGTDHKDACKQVMGALDPSNSNTTDIIRTAAQAVLEVVVSMMEKSGEMSKSLTDPFHKEGIESCVDYFTYAIDELRAVIFEAMNLNSRSFDLRSWLSAVLNFQTTCLEELQVPELDRKLREFGIGNSTEMTANALKIVTELAGLADGLTGGGGRALKEEDGGYPSWMPAQDRKLIASGNNAGAEPDIVVAADGSGAYKTISEAVAHIPNDNVKRFTVYVKAGEYREYVTVTQQNVFMYGDGPKRTRVIGNRHFPEYRTSRSSTFTVTGKGFIGKGMGFFNEAGPEGHQAVALRVQSEQSAFFNCRMNGYQDTLYTHSHAQYYTNCVISGTIDFIFGRASVVFQNCLIILRKPMDKQFNTVTADGRMTNSDPGGTVIHNCRILPENDLVPTKYEVHSYLGRPWDKASRTIVMESQIGDVIRPEGWRLWDGANNHQTCYYAEYQNHGPGSDVKARVPWAKTGIPRAEAEQFLVGRFLQADSWLKATGAKFTDALRY